MPLCYSDQLLNSTPLLLDKNGTGLKIGGGKLFKLKDNYKDQHNLPQSFNT